MNFSSIPLLLFTQLQSRSPPSMVKIDESSCFCKSTATSVFLLTYYGIFLCLLVLFYIIVDIGEEVNHFFGKSGEKRRIIANKLGICGENTEKSSAFVRQNQCKREPVRFPFCMNLLNILKYFFRPLLKNIRRLNQSLEHFQCRRIVVSVADPLVGDRLDVDEAAAVYYAVRSMVLTEYLVP